MGFSKIRILDTVFISLPLVTLHIMLLLVVTTVEKARVLSFFKLFSICDMMTAVMGMGKDRAIFQSIK